MIKGSDGGSLTGLYTQDAIVFGNGTNDGNINNYNVSRCNVSYIASNSNLAANNLFYENIVRTNISMANAQSNAFYNNIIAGSLVNVGANNVFKNNTFLSPDLYGNPSNILNSVFENNVFISVNSLASFNNNIFNNNLFVENLTFPYNANIGSNNIVNQAQNSIFISQSGNTFSYNQNYHLKATSPGVNAGTDGKDIGIYGGLFPWKDGSVPNNPHIQSKTISGTTDQNGNLQINIKVKAQDN